MKKQTLLSSLLAMFVSMTFIEVYAYDIAVINEDGIGIYYNFINNGTELEVTSNMQNEKYSGIIKIPESVPFGNRIYKVTAIGEAAFSVCSGLTFISIPNSVTSIGERAFINCDGLSSIAIPSSVVSIGKGAFYACENLNKVFINDIAAWCNIEFSDYSANPLYYAHHLYDEWNTEITELEIPSNVTSIKDNAFDRCIGLASLTIPNSVKSIGKGAFLYCTELTSVVIPNSVTAIGEGAFLGCSKLPSIIIPNSVITIEDGAFSFCSELTSVIMSNSITNISMKMFEECSKLNTIDIPNNVTSIEFEAFRGCSSLENIFIPNSVKEIGGSAFMSCTSLKSINIPNNLTVIEDNVFYGCSNLSSVSIPNSVTLIGDYAFRSSGLTNLTIPSSVSDIHTSAFADCISLSSVVLPNSLSRIYGGLFSGCSNLVDITIPCSVTIIGDAAFASSGLTSITLSKNITEIEDYAFYNCGNLVSVQIPNSVKSIGRNAFGKCDNLMSVTSMITDPFVINPNVFGQNTKDNGTLLVPFGTIEKYKATEGWNSFVSIMEHKGTCETPTISYDNGKLTFNCATEGATCISSISDTDVATYNTNEVQLNVTYNISVYATKDGYNNSETATATLCWIEQEPKVEGDIDEVGEVKASPLLIQSRENKIIISGADDGTDIRVYNVSGSLIGFAQSRGRQAVVDADLPTGSVVIVKVGNNVVKVILR